MNWAIDYIVEPGYLKAMGIPLLRGRFFTAQDNEHTPLVVVVDEVFAQKYFPGQDPVGKRIHIDRFDRPAEIVGMVGHVKQWGLDTDDQQSLRSGLYIPCMQMPDDSVAMTPMGSGVVVRSEGNSAGLLDSIRRMNPQMTSQQVIFDTQTMESHISDSMASRRFSMILLVIFAVLALLLASVGIYGVGCGDWPRRRSRPNASYGASLVRTRRSRSTDFRRSCPAANRSRTRRLMH